MKILKVRHENKLDFTYIPKKPWVETHFIIDMTEDEYKKIVIGEYRSSMEKGK